MKITGALLIAALVACDVPDPFPDQAPADGGALDAAPTDSCSLGARDCQRWWPQQARDADLAPASISYNALGADPLMFNALLRNPRANVAITHHSLTSLLQENPAADSDAAYFQRQLRDPFARHVVDYLVGCALPETQSVFWTDPVTGTSLAWHGDLGLCPSWQTGSIHENQACTELLSACLLARNNARQEEVLISVHGARSVSNEALVALPLAPAAAGGEPCEAASFAPDCPLEGGAWGPTSNCPGPSNMSYPGRWRSRHIGACTADTPVTLEVTPTACADDLLIRICDGVYGCDFDAAEHRESTAIPCDATSAITFTCASEETFTVMYANADPMQPASAFTVKAEGATYPASEQAAFPWQEGAFYGNLFCQNEVCIGSSPPSSVVDFTLWVEVCDDLDEGCDGPDPADDCDAADVVCDGRDTPGTVVYHWKALVHPVYEPVPGTEHERLAQRADGHTAFLAMGYSPGADVVYQHMYSCMAPNWDPVEAYARERLCAGMTGEEYCAAHSRGRCWSAADTSCQCSEDDQAPTLGDWDYGLCEGNDMSMWLHPLTVFLHDPCDIIPETVAPGAEDDDVACKTVPLCRQTTNPTPWSPPTAPPRPRP